MSQEATVLVSPSAERYRPMASTATVSSSAMVTKREKVGSGVRKFCQDLLAGVDDPLTAVDGFATDDDPADVGRQMAVRLFEAVTGEGFGDLCRSGHDNPFLPFLQDPAGLTAGPR
jgi:hypothetical protein